ncbi:MAG: hypothetical protein KF805_09950 [Phycisphaeraceae bacterium]|nr:hypothetical protein [Phycisphaeraceae bacterium]
MAAPRFKRRSRRWSVQRILAIFTLAGLGTTMAICGAAIAINVSDPADYYCTRPPGAPAPYPAKNYSYAMPSPLQNRVRPGFGAVDQTWRAGMTSFTAKYMQNALAAELRAGQIGPYRSHLHSWAPIFYARHAGKRLEGMWSVTFCGDRTTRNCEWRLYGLGWPLVAFRGEAAHITAWEYDDVHPNRPAKTVDFWTGSAGAFLVPKAQRTSKAKYLPILDQVTVVPYAPTVGLVGNTAVFGSAWFLAFRGRATLRGIRAWQRLKKACCPGCGYSLAGLKAPCCPECGTAVRIHAAAH